MTHGFERVDPPKIGGTLPHDHYIEALHSIAISLKRIADAVSGEGDSILTKPINSYGEGIGDAIQGQMARGATGIYQYDR